MAERSMFEVRSELRAHEWRNRNLIKMGRIHQAHVEAYYEKYSSKWNRNVWTCRCGAVMRYADRRRDSSGTLSKTCGGCKEKPGKEPIHRLGVSLRSAEGKRLGRIMGLPGYKPARHDSHVVLWNKNRKPEKQPKKDNGRHYAHVTAWAEAKPAHVFRHKYRTDPEFNAKQKLRARLRKLNDGDSEIARLIAYNAKRGRWYLRWSWALGYGLDELVEHLRRTVPKGRTFDEFLTGDLHIDHIIPRSKFDLSKADEVRACWCLSNLRLLDAKDNLRKHAKVELLC